MEYPFLKCPKPSAGKSMDERTPDGHRDCTGEDGAVIEFMGRLVRQAIQIEEDCMELLNLLADFLERGDNIG